MMKQIKASVTAQEATLAALSVKTHSGGGENNRNEEIAARLARVCALQEGGLSQGRKLLGVSGQQGQALHGVDKSIGIG